MKIQMRVGALSLSSGGHVRVGLEDSIWAGKGIHAKENSEQVQKIKKIIEEIGLEVALPNETRKMLSLKGKANTNFR